MRKLHGVGVSRCLVGDMPETNLRPRAGGFGSIAGMLESLVDACVGTMDEIGAITPGGMVMARRTVLCQTRADQQVRS